MPTGYRVRGSVHRAFVCYPSALFFLLELHFFYDVEFTGVLRTIFVLNKNKITGVSIAPFGCRVCTVQQRAHGFLFVSREEEESRQGNAPAPKRPDERRAELGAPRDLSSWTRDQGRGTERSPGPATRWHQNIPAGPRSIEQRRVTFTCVRARLAARSETLSWPAGQKLRQIRHGDGWPRWVIQLPAAGVRRAEHLDLVERQAGG
jgi:hypothetical protein